jgi:ADP-ribose pyrophosphatase YjhB (NUDIX family)
MHYVQSHILKVLAFNKFVRFKDMKPPKVDSNLYSYHLRVLQKDKYVSKTDQGYTLSPKGLSYVDGLSNDDRKIRKQPKIVAIFALQNDKGEWLMVRRLMQPYIGQYMLPSGKQHYGESPEAHIQRELLEQIGSDIEVKRCGFTDVRISKNDEIITHINGHVYHGYYDGPLPQDSRKFSYEFLQAGSVEMVENTADLLKAIALGGSFYRSFEKQAA